MDDVFSAILVSLLMAIQAVAATEGRADEELPLHAQRLSDRVLVTWVGDAMQTIKVVALKTAKGIVVMETNLSRAADARIRTTIEKEFGRKDFKYLINTHHHHDHVCGNQVYHEATIVGQRAIPEEMKKEITGEGLVKLIDKFKAMLPDWEGRRDRAAADSRENRYFAEGILWLRTVIAELQEGFKPAFPTLLFDKSLTLDMGDMTLELYAVGGTHSSGDTMIFVPEEGLVMVGDMWPEQVLPYLRKEAPWDLELILENWGRIVEGGREIKHVTMAHSDIKLSVEAFKEQYRYLKTLWNGLSEMRRQGAAFEEAKKRYAIWRDFPFFKEKILKVRDVNIHENNIEAIWAKLPAAKEPGPVGPERP